MFLFYYSATKYKDGQYINFSSTIILPPKLKSSYQNFSVQESSGETIYVTLNKSREYFYGGQINLSGNLKIKLLNNKFKILTLKNPEIVFVKKREKNNLLSIVNSFRQKIIKTFQKKLPQDLAALL